MEKLVTHKWIRSAAEKGSVKVLDLCGGTGIGGIALAKALTKLGCGVELTIVDARREALKRARLLVPELAGIIPQTLCADARRVGTLRGEYDVVLLYGLSTPHFSPWDMVVVAASVGRILTNGIFVVEECDRYLSIVLGGGYKHIVVEQASEKSIVLSIHRGYSVLDGMVERLHIDIVRGLEPVTAKYHMWTLAELCAVLWSWFSEIDIVKLGKNRFLVLCRHPRSAEDRACFTLKPPSISVGSGQL